MSQGRIYSVSFGAVSISAIQDAFELTPADDKPIQMVGITFDQTGNSDVGDAQEEFLRWQVIRGHTTSGSGGSAPAPRPMAPNDPAAGFTAEVNNTTIASAGSPVTLHEGAFNIRGPYIFWWPETTEPAATQGNTTLLVRFPAAPADAITSSGTIYVRENG